MWIYGNLQGNEEKEGLEVYNFSSKPETGAWFSLMRGVVCGKRPCSHRWEFGEKPNVFDLTKVMPGRKEDM